ncbi:MAG: UDP-glucose 4-epimerase GalE [Mariprofundaceae bacterium]|nr:UDP-glucose 4-epimerase GalE [Mariprofundaceae bacterium]
MVKHALVTGGGGYIGSHMVHLLVKSGYQVTVIDNFSTGFRENINSNATLVEHDLCDQKATINTITQSKPDIIFHFAAMSLVGESAIKPWSYLHYNTLMTQNILEGMKRANCKSLVYSSSCAVYGMAQIIPIPEYHPLAPLSPYGESKAMSERMIEVATIEWGLHAVALRYFNVAGCGSNPVLHERHEPETHLIPNLLNSAHQQQTFSLYGTEHDTPDGTAIRDYIHVQDLAEAHKTAGENLLNSTWNGWNHFNLGSGNGYSVRQVIAAVETCTGVQIETESFPPRLGDPPKLLADDRLWRKATGQAVSKQDITMMIHSAWKAMADE